MNTKGIILHQFLFPVSNLPESIVLMYLIVS